MKSRRNISFDENLRKAAAARAASLSPFIRDFTHYLSVLIALDLRHDVIGNSFPIQGPAGPAGAEGRGRVSPLAAPSPELASLNEAPPPKPLRTRKRR